MAIQFQFTLNDEDALNLMSFIRDAENDMSIRIVEASAIKSPKIKEDPILTWYKNHRTYIRKLRSAILKKQKRIKDSQEFNI